MSRSEATERGKDAVGRRRLLAGIGVIRPDLSGKTRGDRVFRLLTVCSALVLLLLLAGIALELWSASGLSIHHSGLSFVWGRTWNPITLTFGALPFLYGTLVTTLIALVIAAPAGVAIAIYLVEMAPRRLRGSLSFLVELLAAVPSVVFGLWGIFVFIPWLRNTVEIPLSLHLGFIPLFTGPAYGPGMLAAGLILAIMVLPTVAAISRDVLLAVSKDQRDAALALGSTRWEMIRNVVLPAGRQGIVGAIGLGIGRALGETIATTMVIGNTPQISASLLSTGYTLSSVVANEFTEASTPVYLSALMEIALVLFAITLVVNILARLVVRRGYR